MKVNQILGAVFSALVVCGASVAQAATLSVNNASQFTQALSKARGGDVISVSAGANLGSMVIDGKKYANLSSAASMITIKSASTSNRAFFQQGLQVRNVKNLRFSGMLFKCSIEGKDKFVFEDSRNIEVLDSVFQGIKGSKLHINGPHFNRNVGVTVGGNDFFDLWSSLSLGNSDQVLIAENQLLRGLYDSIHLGSSNSNVVVEDNVIRATPTDAVKHVDLIQIINMGSGTPNRNITFRNNDIRATNGVGIHGIYFGNHDAQADGGRDQSEWYRGLTIENNYIETTQFAAIAVSYATNVVIRNNQTLRPAGAPKTTRIASLPTILVETADRNVSIRNNITTTPPRAGHLVGGWTQDKEIPAAWDVAGNLVKK